MGRSRPVLAGWLLWAGALASGDDILTAAVGGRQVRAAGDRVLVRFGRPGEAAMALRPADVVASAQPLPDGRLTVVRLAPGTRVEEALRRLRALPGVVAAEPDYVVWASTDPNDPLWDNQCGLRRAQLPGAWAVQRGGPDVTIAILDSGVAYDHPDLIGNLRRNAADPPNGIDDDGNGLIDDFRGWDFSSGDNDPHADRGDGVGLAHGTHVAGIAAAVTNNRLGVAGTGWGCSYLPIRVLDAFGLGYLSDVARGLEYAADMGCAVANLSLEGPFSRAVQPAIDYAYARGVVICAAAGNAAQEFTTDPATWTTPVCNDGDDPVSQNRVLGVAAIRCDNVKLGLSNYGSTFSLIDLTAPGSRTLSTSWPGGGYAQASGTSQAAPHVAGVAALLVAQRGRLGPDAVAQIMRSAAVNIDADNPAFAGKLGAGRLNAQGAISTTAPGPVVGVSVIATDGPTDRLVRAQPGTEADLQVVVRNLGAAPALGVLCHLTSGDPRVALLQANAAGGDLAPGERRALSGFRVRIDADVRAGTRIPLGLTTEALGAGPWADGHLSLPVGWNAAGEPDGSCEEAFAASVGTVYNRRLEQALDQDWFAFDAQAGQRYYLETRPRGGSAPQTWLSIRGLDCGREVLALAGSPAKTRWTCPVTGRYAVAVTGGEGLWTGLYRFVVRPWGAETAGPVDATDLAVDDDSLGASAGDGDGRAEPGETVELRVQLTNRGPLPVTGVTARLSSPRTAVKVLTADAAFADLSVGAASWSATPYVIRLAPGLAQPTAPPLTVAVASDQGSWTSTLRLDVGRSPLAEPDSTCVDAALIFADGFRHPRAFEAPDDQDWFAFEATAGVRYRVTAWPGDAGVEGTLIVHNLECGAPVAFGQDAGGTLSEATWDCSATGRHFVVTRPVQGSATGAYALSVRPLTNLGAAEPDDTCAAAALIPANGTWQTRDFGVPGDVDWVRFPVVDGTTYLLETGPAEGQTPREAKAPPDGLPRVPDTTLELHDHGCGAVLGTDDDSGPGLFSRVMFSASGDGEYAARIGEYDGALGAYQVRVRSNRAPALSFTGEPGYMADLVQPDAGWPHETQFAFRVTYTDLDGDPAAFVRLRLFVGGVEATGSPFAMQAVSGVPVTGVRYSVRRTLPQGEYEGLVEADDGYASALGPPTALSPGPSCSSTGKSTITMLTVAPGGLRTTEIRVSVANAAHLSVRVVNLAGREVRRLAVDRPVGAGVTTLLWNGTTSGGLGAPPGTYLVEVTSRAADGTQSRRVAAFRRP